MNIELLDPFGRQIPDRVDATLHCPVSAEAPRKTVGPSSAYHVAWNRRGTYLTTGYANGTVAVYSLLSRSLVALYPPVTTSTAIATTTATTEGNTRSKNTGTNATHTASSGVTSVSWARRSRTLLAGSAGDTVVQLLDLTHPYGPEGASLVTTQTKTDEENNNTNKDADADDAEEGGGGKSRTSKAEKNAPPVHDATVIAPLHTLAQTKDTAFVDADDPDVQLVTEQHILKVREVTTASASSKKNRRVSGNIGSYHNRPPRPKRGKRYPALAWSFGEGALLGGSLQIHPTIQHAGLATFQDGRLVVFYVSPDAWYRINNKQEDDQEGEEEQEEEEEEDRVHVLTMTTSDSYNIAFAAFSPTGKEILAATKDGYILGWKDLEETTFWKALAEKAPAIETTPSVVATIATKPTLWQLLVSRNGKHFVVNAADGVLRLYHTSEFWEKGSNVQPTSQFQDVVNKVKFTSCDFSGDGEYLVGGVNGNDNRYELYIWSTATGMLVDTLRGVSVHLYAVAWHPNRALLAAATSDGLVDLWGPRINWTAFAPDFQALPRNVEYVEREDEFDQTENGTYVTSKIDAGAADATGALADPLDVRTVVPVPAFASDSEDETSIFNFEPRVSITVKQSGRFKIADKNADD